MENRIIVDSDVLADVRSRLRALSMELDDQTHAVRRTHYLLPAAIDTMLDEIIIEMLRTVDNASQLVIAIDHAMDMFMDIEALIRNNALNDELLFSLGGHFH